MKKSLLAGASLGALALATGAHAADLAPRLPYKAPPLAVAPWSWTGFYIGGTVGGVWSHDKESDNLFLPSGTVLDKTTLNKAGVIGGIEAGFNYQINQVVLGIEADASWSSLDDSVAVAGNFIGDTYSSRLNVLGTVRGRLGWAVGRTLFYGTGGAAFADLKDRYNNTSFPFTVSPKSSLTGWTAGGGIEYAFVDHWTVKAEYLHVGFSDRSVTSDVGGIPYSFKFKDALDIGRVGINYKF